MCMYYYDAKHSEIGVRGAMDTPDFAIIAANPTVFKHMVLPPVLGPVITTTRVFLDIKKSTGTGRALSRVAS